MGHASWTARRRDLLLTFANCPKTRSVSIHDRCKARYGAASLHVDPTGPKQRLPIDPLVQLEPQRARGESPNEADPPR
jgi:hypothetical protein